MYVFVQILNIVRYKCIYFKPINLFIIRKLMKSEKETNYTWIVVAMDLSKDECFTERKKGGTGKSLFSEAIKKIRKNGSSFNSNISNCNK